MKPYILILAAFAVCIGCTDEASPPPNATAVHIAGFITTSDGAPVASYWKDGAYTKLVSDSAYSNTKSLVVDGATTLIGGYMVTPTPPSKVVIWANGVANIVTEAFGDSPLLASENNNRFAVWFNPEFEGWVINNNGSTQPLLDTAESWPTSIALLNNDLYVAGVAQSLEFFNETNEYYSDQYAQCWKNDELIFRETERSFAWSVFTYENDIYIGGNLQFYEANGIACYWKNGVRVDLTDGDENAAIHSIFVVDGHVYGSGTYGGHACYWKDGVITMLPHDGTIRSGGNSIFVNGSDVHVVGYDDGHPAYWKNNVKETFEHETRKGELKVIVVE